MSLLIPELERQLRDVVRARVDRHGRRQRPAAVVVLIAAGIPALVIAVIALSLHASHTPARPRVPGSKTATLSRVGTRRLLGVASRRPGSATCDASGGVLMSEPTAAVARVAVSTRQSGEGTIAGHAWTLRTVAAVGGLNAIEAGRFTLDRRVYGTCAPNSANTAFELINTPGHGIIYGYAPRVGVTVAVRVPRGSGAISIQRLALPGGGTFFVGALARPGCRYRSLTLAVSQPVTQTIPGTAPTGTATLVTVLRATNPAHCTPNQPATIPDGTTTPLSSGPTLGPAPARIVETIPLRPPTNTGRGRGTVELIHQGHIPGITITATGLAANTRHNAYAVWLYRSPTDERLLGFVNPAVRSNGRLKTAGVLPTNASRYDTLLITLETRPRPHVHGQLILVGRGTF